MNRRRRRSSIRSGTAQIGWLPSLKSMIEFPEFKPSDIILWDSIIVALLNVSDEHWTVLWGELIGYVWLEPPDCLPFRLEKVRH
jgi:hypothetical protein